MGGSVLGECWHIVERVELGKRGRGGEFGGAGGGDGAGGGVFGGWVELWGGKGEAEDGACIGQLGYT